MGDGTSMDRFNVGQYTTRRTEFWVMKSKYAVRNNKKKSASNTSSERALETMKGKIYECNMQTRMIKFLPVI